jgi:asparagine synthase (glutamine-hydrolysing)
MCGIVGYTHFSRILPSGVLNAGIQGMVHRGPDQQAGHTTPHVSLGAARLRVVDLEGGDQPMHSLDGNHTIVFNGEIYNHSVLRKELEQLGRRFRTRCDTEVVLNAYLEWGSESFARLRGMFAVALWSEQEQRLILARDRSGIKPLYYYLQRGELFFGSEMKCIFAHPDVPRRIDLNGLNCYLSLNYVPGPLTLIEGITKLMPGHLLDWQRGQVSISSFAPRPIAAPAPANMGQATEELDNLLRLSVSEQMISDVPMGVWLSGGVDSSTITHYAAHLNSKALKTFSITFHGKSFDESTYIRAVSERYGTQHTEIDLNENADLCDSIAELSYYSDEPGADAGAVPVWYLAKLTRRHVTVALSGEGADELFGGYLTYKADRYRRACAMMPRPLLRAAKGCANLLPASDEKIGFDYKLKRFLQGSLLSAEAAHVFWNGTFSEEEKRGLFRFANQTPLSELLGHVCPGRSFERFLRFDQSYSLPDALLYKVDRMSMAHSVEVRPPFLDDRIVDFAARLPRHFKIRGTQSKLVLRELMKRALPKSVLNRPKIGLDIPIHEWFRGFLRPLLVESLSEEAVRQTGLFNWSVVERLMEEHQNRTANWGYHLWGLLTLILWMKRWQVEAPVMSSQVIVPREEGILEAPSLLW